MHHEAHPSVPRRAAFTLIELLVVIVIIAILAGIGFAVSGSVRKTSDRVKCLANLRTIGAGITSYIGDNEGYLPGPLWTAQSCWYTEGDRGMLATLLAPYLGAVANSESQKAESFVCPAWQRGAPYEDDWLFVMNSRVVVNGITINPWGDADEDEDEPATMARLADIPLARTWAMQDIDAEITLPGLPRGRAAKPVHGDTRNALFFDFHVESVPLNYGQ